MKRQLNHSCTLTHICMLGSTASLWCDLGLGIAYICPIKRVNIGLWYRSNSLKFNYVSRKILAIFLSTNKFIIQIYSYWSDNTKLNINIYLYIWLKLKITNFWESKNGTFYGADGVRLTPCGQIYKTHMLKFIWAHSPKFLYAEILISMTNLYRLVSLPPIIHSSFDPGICSMICFIYLELFTVSCILVYEK
jgi:hypothetical protein